MLPKSKRIPRELFKNLLNSRKYLNSPHLILRIGPSERVGVAVSVSKKVSKKAVVRNRTRRRIYSAISPLIPDLDNNLYLVVAKPGADKLKGEALKSELAELIKKG